MEEDVIRAKRIELLDAEGQPSIILTGSKEGSSVGGASLTVQDPAGTTFASMDVTRDGRPYITLAEGKTGASMILTFEDGMARIGLENEDGTFRLVTPSSLP